MRRSLSLKKQSLEWKMVFHHLTLQRGNGIGLKGIELDSKKMLKKGCKENS
jgi:hypothetical protein